MSLEVATTGPHWLNRKPILSKTSLHDWGLESIKTLVKSLSSVDEGVQTAAEHELLKLAGATPGGRKVVIKELLISISQKRELDGTHSVLSPEMFGYWTSVTTLLRELKASEGIEVMIRCVNCSNGYAGNMGEPPAAYNLVRMGALAVPKLSHALLTESDGYKRIKIVLRLSRIGGPQAKSALKRALSSEKDKTVREYIRSAL